MGILARNENLQAGLIRDEDSEFTGLNYRLYSEVWKFLKIMDVFIKVESGKFDKLPIEIKKGDQVIRIPHKKLVWVEKNFSSGLEIWPWPWVCNFQGH